MNILFVITNINGTYGDAYSFGLASIASIARDKGFGYDYAVINTTDDYKNFFYLVQKIKPTLIAYTSVSSQFMFVKELAAKIRQAYGEGIIQVCGGIHPTISPTCIFETESLNGIFIGEGELAFSDFLDKLADRQPYIDTKNFAYNLRGKLIKNELYPLIAKLDMLPFPEREKYGYERFIKQYGYATFIFNRGCPYLCSYCSNHAIAKTYGLAVNQPRFRSPDHCIDEIETVIRRYPTPKISIGDDTFGLNRQWVENFCKEYVKRIHLPFLCQLRVDLVDEELIRLLKRAGCIRVTCGIESGNDYIRNTIMKRNISNAEIVRAYSLFRKYRIPANAINIIGLPHETITQIWDTIKLSRKINPAGTGVNIFYPYKGTELGDYCFKERLVDEKAYGTFSKERRESILNFSPQFKKDLSYIYRNWSFLVYRNRLLKLADLLVRDYMRNKMPVLWKVLKLFKRHLLRR